MIRGKILVVEDNPVTRKMFRVTIAAEGHQVLEAENAAEALSIAAREPIDLVLADVLLGDMDGVALAAALRRLPGKAHVPIVAVTGFLTKVEQARAGTLGFDDALLKPVEPAHLIQVVQAFLRAGAADAPKERRVLVVDDDPVQLKMVRVALARAGYHVTTAASAAGALESARAERPDAILSDVLMPDTDGFRLCLSAREDPTLADVPFVLMSAHLVDAVDGVFAKRLGASDYVTRSEGLDRIVDALGKALATNHAAPSAISASAAEGAYFTHVVARQSALIAKQAQRCAQQAAALRVLGSISDALSRNADVDAALGDVLAQCLDAAGLAVGAIFLVTPAGHLTLRAELGRAGDGDLTTFFGRPELLAYVRDGKTPVALPGDGIPADVAADVLGRAGLTAALLLPIRSGAEGHGVMFMGSREAEVLREDWHAFVHTVAGQIGQGLVLSQAFARIAASERARLFSERLAALGTLAGGVAHEINNPLVYILSNLEHVAATLGGASDLGAEKRGELAAVVAETQQGAERVRAIVRDLHVFGRGDDLSPGPGDVRRAIDAAVSLVAADIRPRARLVCDLTETPLVEAPEARLGQVLVNLLLNAAQALPLGNPDANEIRVTTSVDGGGHVVVRVSDTGCGIAEENRRRVFDPFFTTRPVGQGTGLGLSICHSIVRHLGGDLTFESDVGKGTTFQLTLPIAAAASGGKAVEKPVAAAAREEPLASDRAKLTRRGRVLVVDDEPAIGRSIKRWLQADHDVTALTRGKEALDLVALDTTFDAILCDISMPEMSGGDLYDELVRLGSPMAVRMVFLTGGAFTPEAVAFLERVDRPHLDKPFKVADLRRIIADLVH